MAQETRSLKPIKKPIKPIEIDITELYPYVDSSDIANIIFDKLKKSEDIEPIAWITIADFLTLNYPKQPKLYGVTANETSKIHESEFRKILKQYNIEIDEDLEEFYTDRDDIKVVVVWDEYGRDIIIYREK